MSESKGNKKQDFSRYDQMSTAELEQMLRLDFQSSEEGVSDLDAILYISDLLAQRNGPFDSDAAWQQFQTQYRPHADGRSLYDFADEEDCSASEEKQASATSSRAQSRSARRLRWPPLLAAVLAALLLGSIVTQAAGVDVWGVIAQWTDETFHFVSAGSDDTSGVVGNHSVQEELSQYLPTLQALGMDDLFPTWYPDGFTPGDLEITELHDRVTAHVTYFGEDRTYTVVIDHFMQPQSNTGTFEKDDTPVEEYDHNGQTFYILSNLDSLTATTYDGEFMTMIYGGLTREEIKAVIDSIPDPQSP